MSGINWEYIDDSTSYKYWAICSDNYIYLRQLFIDFEFRFEQPLRDDTEKFLLSKEQVEFLSIGIESRLDKLLVAFDPLNPDTKAGHPIKYKGIDYRFLVRDVKKHHLIYRLIKFHGFLTESIELDKKIMFWGGSIG